jgi:mediator of RNA polymerase II transcription subunit 5
MFLDILFASFQVLRKSQSGPKGAVPFQQTGLFIRNKLPSILATISASSFGVVSSEQAITSSWHQIKAELITPELLACGQKFLQICSLHHLIASDTAQQLIGDQELAAGLAKGLYSKDDLVSQINSNHSKIVKFVDELIRADGNAAAITQAIVEVRKLLCRRYLLTLKDHRIMLPKQGHPSSQRPRKCHREEACRH